MLRANMPQRHVKIDKRNNTQTLTAGLKIVATWYLNVERNGEGQMLCKFKDTQCTNDSHDATIYCPKATIYVTGDLAFQAMALGKESMAGWWCMLCKASRAQFLDEESELWDMESLLECGTIAEQRNAEPKLGVKEKPWWPFIPFGELCVPAPSL